MGGGEGYNKANRPTTGTGQPACKAKIMKMAKKFLAVALAGVLALSVLTGCGDSANTKSIAEAMSDMVKAGGVTFKEDEKLNTKARAIIEKLAKADATETVALADNGPTEIEETMTEGLTPDQKKKIMTIMGESYNDQFVWINWTETKGYNATTQAYNLLHGTKNVHAPKGKRPADTWYIGTTTVTRDGTTYRFAVITNEGNTNQGSKE